METTIAFKVSIVFFLEFIRIFVLYIRFSSVILELYIKANISTFLESGKEAGKSLFL
ncbi:hypothetical protein AAG747_10350 [Rapidithrix thailandica]|uniref:Uncharacterized protein n=1 Tax=Rapidithrix thailandica TaxID=413964 RepID=A0AAW9RU74_9BACT